MRFCLLFAWSILTVVSPPPISVACLLFRWSLCCLRCFRSIWIVFLISFFMESLSRHIDASTLSSMLARPLSSSFLDTYSLSMSSLGYKVLRIVICFSCPLVHLSEFSPHHFNNDSVHLTRGTAHVLFLLWDSWCRIRLRAASLFVWGTLLLFFSFFAIYLMVSASNIHKYS